jgi:hypothetical protein
VWFHNTPESHSQDHKLQMSRNSENKEPVVQNLLFWLELCSDLQAIWHKFELYFGLQSISISSVQITNQLLILGGHLICISRTCRSKSTMTGWMKNWKDANNPIAFAAQPQCQVTVSEDDMVTLVETRSNKGTFCSCHLVLKISNLSQTTNGCFH